MHEQSPMFPDDLSNHPHVKLIDTATQHDFTPRTPQTLDSNLQIQTTMASTRCSVTMRRVAERYKSNHNSPPPNRNLQALQNTPPLHITNLSTPPSLKKKR
jgi:hypothetical protein